MALIILFLNRVRVEVRGVLGRFLEATEVELAEVLDGGDEPLLERHLPGQTPRRVRGRGDRRAGLRAPWAPTGGISWPCRCWACAAWGRRPAAAGGQSWTWSPAYPGAGGWDGGGQGRATLLASKLPRAAAAKLPRPSPASGVGVRYRHLDGELRKLSK